MDSQEIANIIDDYIVEFADKTQPLQQELYSKAFNKLKDLSLDENGLIKRTISNFNQVNTIKNTLESIVKNSEYKKNVSSLRLALKDITEMQTKFFEKNFKGFSEPKVIEKMLTESFDNAVMSLTEAGMSANVTDAASKIVLDGVKAGDSFFKMSKNLEQFILGNPETDGKLVSYTKQIVNDTLHGSARNYNSVVTSELGLKWYQYIGALTKGVKNKTNKKRHGGSREWCIALVNKQWIHESELPSICRGNINGKTVSLQGLMPNTTKDNVIDRCGGYNCNHQMVAVPDNFVPKNIRKKFENKGQAQED
jgi:hypothetical protein